jgi:hypothetical protein
MRRWLQNLNIRPDPDSGAITDQFIHALFEDPLNKQGHSLFQTSFLDLNEPPLKHFAWWR